MFGGFESGGAVVGRVGDQPPAAPVRPRAVEHGLGVGRRGGRPTLWEWGRGSPRQAPEVVMPVAVVRLAPRLRLEREDQEPRRHGCEAEGQDSEHCSGRGHAAPLAAMGRAT